MGLWLAAKGGQQHHHSGGSGSREWESLPYSVEGAHMQQCGVLPDSGSHPIPVAILGEQCFEGPEARTHIDPVVDRPRLGVGFGLQLASP